MQATLPQAGAIGVDIHDLDPRAIAPHQAAELRKLAYEHKLVVLRGVDLSAPEYIEFARALGRPQIYFQENYHHPEHPEIFVSSNQPMNGKKVGVAGTGRYWHTDYQFFDEPLPLTMVYPQQLPEGPRQTLYADMQRAFETLPDDLKQFALTHRSVHEAKWRYKVTPDDIDKSITELLEEFGAITPPVSHPMVLQHPALDRQQLYVSEGFTVGIEGLPIEEGREHLKAFFEHSTQEQFVHCHNWEHGDILLWDNRQVMHMASKTLPGQPSVSYRIGVYDDLPFYTNR